MSKKITVVPIICACLLMISSIGVNATWETIVNAGFSLTYGSRTAYELTGVEGNNTNAIISYGCLYADPVIISIYLYPKPAYHLLVADDELDDAYFIDTIGHHGGAGSEQMGSHGNETLLFVLYYDEANNNVTSSVDIRLNVLYDTSLVGNSPTYSYIAPGFTWIITVLVIIGRTSLKLFKRRKERNSL